MIIAHRGIHDNLKVAENSMKAFKLALEKKYNIEFDIHITKDNKLVIFHDDNLKRMTGIDRNIEDLTLDEVRNLKLLNTEEKIPTFRELLDLVSGKVLLDIEIKSTKKVKLVCDLVLKELENYDGEILLKSFNPFIVKELKKNSNYKVGLLMTKKSPNKILNLFVNTGLIYLFKFDFLAINKNMLNSKYYNKHIKKYPIYIWTLKGLNDADNYVKKYPNINLICNIIK